MKKLFLLITIVSCYGAIAQTKKLRINTRVSGAMETFSLYLKQSDDSYALLKTREEDSGVWTFDSLSAGTYRVHIAIPYAKYLSTWYPNKPIWDEAQDIVLTDDSTGIEVGMIANPVFTGPASIAGQLNEGMLKALGDPLTNIRVIIKDGNDVLVKMVTSNDSGKFNVTNLPVGTYKIIVDMVNVPSNNPKTVVLDSSNLTASVDLTVNATGTVTTGLKGTGLNQNEITLYPNPVADQLRTNSKENIEISIYDITGSLVIKGFINKSQSISLQQLPKGLYFASISSPSSKTVHTRKIIKE
jgi:hypothetical protein